MTPFDHISTSDLVRLQVCVRTYFGQLYRDGVLVKGETSEENERFMRMWGQIMRHYAPGQADMNAMEMAILCMDRELEKRNEDGL